MLLDVRMTRTHTVSSTEVAHILRFSLNARLGSRTRHNTAVTYYYHNLKSVGFFTARLSLYLGYGPTLNWQAT